MNMALAFKNQTAEDKETNTKDKDFSVPITTYEDVKDQSTKDYFRNNKFSIDAFEKKYALYPGETYVQALKRVCDFVASVEETDALKEYWSARFFDEIYNDWWHPAGSIMQGAGSNRKVSLCNCTTCSLGAGREDEEWDNLESIIRNLAYTVAKTAAYRQGLGVDFSRLRPVGTQVLNSANESTGSVHWMKFIDSIGYYVGQKGRIPAMLFSLRCDHPDIEEFVQVKSDYTKIQNANISVQCTNALYEAAKNNEDWELKFEIPGVKAGDRIYIDVHSVDKDCQQDEKGWYKIASHDREAETITKTVKARKLMQLIAKNMFMNAEPGIQNIDIAKKYSNSDYLYDPNDEYDSRIISTNACSEQYLSRDSLCVLASLNCERFSTDPEAYTTELCKVAETVNRFLDNVNTCELVYNTYATPHQKMAIEKLRRTGAGYTNIAGWLFKENLAYGTKKANKSIEEFTKVYNYYLYESSIRLGKEKGSFGLFNREKLEKSPFIQRMMKEGLVFETLRNVTLSSIAPTGTLSLMFRDMVMSYGIEQGFGMYYWKRTRMSGKYVYYFCVPHIVREVYKAAGFEIPINADAIEDTWDGKYGRPVAEFIEEHKDDVGVDFQNATEISPFDKLDCMAGVMKWIDSSISVTYMLPEDTDWKDVYKFIMQSYEKGVKSIAAFPDRKMYGIIAYTPFKDLAFKLKDEGVMLHPQNFDDDELKELNMSKEEIKLHTADAPKRLPKLDADIYSITVQGEKFVIVVGLQNGVPYEIFGGEMNGFNIKKKTMKGQIEKIARGKYALEFGDVVIEDFSQQFSPVEKILFRSASLMLRHGIAIEHIVDQFQKATEDMTTLTSAICRVLKKYITDGQKVTGKSCPACGGELIYHAGCVKCSSCEYQGCD